MYKQLAELFAGNNISYIQATLTGSKDDRGKRKADYLTIHKPLTDAIWNDHIEGKIVIGLKPERDDKVKWGCIDIDPSNYEGYFSKKYVDIITKAKLPLVPVLSKSGGLHLFLFLKDWTKIEDVRNILDEWNTLYFLSKEIFPMNKAVGMPYTNYKNAVEHAINENGVGLNLESFLFLANQKKISIQELKNFEKPTYEPEAQWSNYPPCVQKLIQEKWHLDTNRNNSLFNVLALEIKKNPLISLDSLIELGKNRNREIFTKPLPDVEVERTAKSVKKGGYFYLCPPKHAEMQSICNKEVCMTRSLGIQAEVPAIVDDFKNPMYSCDLKTTYYEFTYENKHIVMQPENMIDEKAWRLKLMRHSIFWKTLPKSKANPNPYETMLSELMKRFKENVHFNYVDTVEDERYQTLKDFFEDKIEVDDFDKLKDGYIVLDSQTYICYFTRATIDKWLKDKKNKVFNSTIDALRLLNCTRLEYHKGVKNVWSVVMPKFINHESIKKSNGKVNNITEMDNDYHTGKFRNPETEADTPKDS
jgi:hypothetical protein